VDIQIILLLISVNLLFYYCTTEFAGICDDIPVFNQNVEVPKNKWMYFWYHLHGRKYVSWKLAHWQTLSIHTLNCILIYFAFGRNNISALAALLFAVNPVNNQCSIWISGKGYSMNLTCALLMWIFPLASPIIYIYGAYFNGASILLFPLMFLFTKHWYLALMLLWGIQRERGRVFNKTDPASKFNTETNAELLSLKPHKFIIALKTYGYYFTNTITARILGYYHKYLFLHGVNKESNKDSYKIDIYFFIGLAVVLTTFLTFDLGLLWFTITIAMWCNFISFNQTIANRYIYMGNAGLMLTIAILVNKCPYLTGMLLAYYLTRLGLFLIFYKSEYYSIEYSCLEQPDFFYPWQNRAVHCFQMQNYQGALGNMLKAAELRPTDWKLNYNICQIFMVLGNIKECKKYFEIASSCTIMGREDVINKLMVRLKDWIESVEKQAKENNNHIDLDLKKFDMQR